MSRMPEYLSRVRNERFDVHRLKRIHEIGPETIYVGLASFEGYVVFVYPKGNTAVLDCPRLGNALYVMDADKWKFFSQLTKTELLFNHRQEVHHVIHIWGWFHELEMILRRRGVL